MAPVQFRKGEFCLFWNDTGVVPYNYVAHIYDFATGQPFLESLTMTSTFVN